MTRPSRHQEVVAAGHPLELRMVEGDDPPLVFLHEGLGSIGLWRGFDERLAASTGRATLAYSRAGHGWSGSADLPRFADFMHHEALLVLPEVLEVRTPVGRPILVGHSDGASIALIHAASHPVSGLVLIAPHVFVEPKGIAAIEATRARFEDTDLRERMTRHHRDPAATFYGWSDIWLDPAFRDWNIEDRLPEIDCPLLLIQGVDDEYGTLAQLDAVESGVDGPVERLILDDCGHSPHLDRPEPVLRAVTRFVAGLA